MKKHSRLFLLLSLQLHPKAKLSSDTQTLNGPFLLSFSNGKEKHPSRKERMKRLLKHLPILHPT